MRKLGIGVGDRVAGYLPNCPEAIEIMAATSSIGAIWSSTSPDFGVNGVLDRYQQISPKIIFSVEAVAYNNKVKKVKDENSTLSRKYFRNVKFSKIIGTLTNIQIGTRSPGKIKSGG